MFDQDPPGIVARRVALNPAVSGYDNVQDAIDNGAIGGGGGVTVRKFPFAFDTADILTGAALYTPTIGDILLDAWVEIDTAWNGTTPTGDVGMFDGDNLGFFANANAGIDMAAPDVTGNIGDGILGSAGGGPPTSDLYAAQAPAPAGPRFIPGKVVAAHPIKVCVSQNGHNDGADPGSTQGAGVVYLVTATPV
jgi:hypothetical protein